MPRPAATANVPKTPLERLKVMPKRCILEKALSRKWAFHVKKTAEPVLAAMLGPIFAQHIKHDTNAGHSVFTIKALLECSEISQVLTTILLTVRMRKEVKDVKVKFESGHVVTVSIEPDAKHEATVVIF
jgi:hypothetical protein